MPTNNVHRLYLLRDLIANFVVTQQSNCVPAGRQTEILIALMTEAVSISETSVTLYQSTRRSEESSKRTRPLRNQAPTGHNYSDVETEHGREAVRNLRLHTPSTYRNVTLPSRAILLT
jgi:hypothetical protein